MADLTLQGRALARRPDASLFRLARDAGIFVPSSCGGQGKCRECVVEVEEGIEALSPPAPEEDGLAEGFRLACRTHVRGDTPVACHTLSRGRLRIVSEAEGLGGALPAPLARVYRDGGRWLRGDEVLGEAAGRPLGIALDLGTTSVALALCDLASGRTLAVQSFENPQRFAGSDVMARIAFDGARGGGLLQRTLVAYLARAIDELPCEPREVLEVAVAGNTTMRDLFFGLDVQSIGRDPYRSLTEDERRRGVRASTSLAWTGARSGLPVHPEARVLGMPLVASHLGADTAAALLATGVGRTEGVQALMDLGTNTELVIGDREHLLAASCPAGPAFEGGGIRFGMPGVDGAIERVERCADGSLALGVIGGGTPQGICGSGLVELLAMLLEEGRMNELGRFEEDDDEEGVDLGHGLYLSEADVGELAQAKGANAAGFRVLLEAYGIDLGAVERFHLAGGFGRHLDPRAARGIGLVPDLPDGRLVQVGNAALEGAKAWLLSTVARTELEERLARVRHVRLELEPSFFDAFVDGCAFRPFRGASGR